MKPGWRKILVNTGWLLLLAAVTVVLVSAANKKSGQPCAGIQVSVSGPGDHFFVDEKDVKGMLSTGGAIVGRPINQIDLHLLEHQIESDRWIHNAELFFDNQHVLQAVVVENEPIARVFNRNGRSFYIDSACRQLPLKGKLSARVPMFSNVPAGPYHNNSLDSSLLAQLKEMALFINNDPFWSAQIAQVHINDDRELEIIPTVGNHQVYLGKPADIPAKLNRLYTFYKQVWAKVGLEKYEKLDVQYSGQVVATRRGSNQMGLDTSRAIATSAEWVQPKDPVATIAGSNNRQDQTGATNITSRERATVQEHKSRHQRSNPASNVQNHTRPKTAINRTVPQHQTPKAVMGKRKTN